MGCTVAIKDVVATDGITFDPINPIRWVCVVEVNVTCTSAALLFGQQNGWVGSSTLK